MFSPVAFAETANVGRDILFDVEARRSAISELSPKQQEYLCGISPKEWRSHQGFTTLRPTPGYGGDPRMGPFSATIMDMTARIVGFRDESAEWEMWKLLDRWAKGRSMTKIENDLRDGRYSRRRVMLPTIIGYSILLSSTLQRGEMDDELEARRERIEDWLEGLIDTSLSEHAAIDMDDISSRNNHVLLYASVLAAWGAHTGNHGQIADAVEIVEQALATMRQDGSLPLETKRGARALWYQRHAIASMVTVAEIAARHGLDLYGTKIDGKSLHDAVRFLIKGIDDPQIVTGYASTNFSPGPYEDYTIQDMGFMRLRGHGRHYMAWFEIYKARFPHSAETQELERLLTLFSGDYQPMIDEYSGGNMSCFFATH